MITALILAAGKGVRFGSPELPKQFCEVDGVPLFIHSVRIYADMPEIDRIVVAANPRLLEATRTQLEKFDLADAVQIIEGGDTRQESVQNSAVAIDESTLTADDIVILHNAVSPNTPPDFIRQCLSELEGSDAVQACVPDTRTVFRIDGQYVDSVLPRSELVYNCDPLVYRGDVFREIVSAQRQRGMSGDTTSDMARELGYRIRLAFSDYANIKVTNRWDLHAVTAAIAQDSN